MHSVIIEKMENEDMNDGDQINRRHRRKKRKKTP